MDRGPISQQVSTTEEVRAVVRSAHPSLYNRDLAPVTPSERTWTWVHFASLWVGMSICIPTYTLASSLVDRGWTWQSAVGAIVLGNLIVFLPIVLNSHAGTRYGVPFPVFSRAAFGVTGAHVPALRALPLAHACRARGRTLRCRGDVHW